jgi:hypothetical protein
MARRSGRPGAETSVATERPLGIRPTWSRARIGVALPESGLRGATRSRVIKFQSVVRCAGKTGWMLSAFCDRLAKPTAKLALSCMGTLIRLATGFCVAFCSDAVEA